MKRGIIIKPIISEKSEKSRDRFSQYVFAVKKDSNKIEIKKAVEQEFSVKVMSVNTLIVPGKNIVKNTKAGLVKGTKSAYKKAIVRLEAGEVIELLGEV